MAQSVPVASATSDPVDRLSLHLRTLAVAPKSLSALLGAGQAAIEVGDPNAALGFFVRADQVDPRSGPAKAGLAAALVALERPDDALPLFAQAMALGMPEASIARDRGLAYDLRGDSRRAQRDYLIALKREPDDETTRRLALSLGISGDRSQAMALLEPLLRKQDQSAWRARAFILAMNGDVPGASGIARQVMPANLAATMVPFLTRLALLNPADRAHAVNFGTMPTNGVALAAVEIGDPFRPVGGGGGSRSTGRAPGDGLIPAGDPLGPRPSDAQTARIFQPWSVEPRRRPGRQVAAVGAAPQPTPPKLTPPNPTVASPAPVFPAAAAPGFRVEPMAPPPAPDARLQTRIGGRVAAIDPGQTPPVARDLGTLSVIVGETRLPPPTTALSKPGVAPITPTITALDRPAFEVSPSGVALTAAPVSASIAATAVAPATAAPATLVGPPVVPADRAVPQPAAAKLPVTSLPAATLPPTPVAAIPSQSVLAAPTARLAAILDGVQPEDETSAVALPSAAEIRAARRLVQRKAAETAAVAAAEQAQKVARAAEMDAARRSPARLWVQVATGNNTRGLGPTWARIRDANAAALRGKAAWSIPFKATNRLLVGPMKSAAEARTLVNLLGKGGVSATTFSSEAGQEVARVGGK